MKTIKLEQDSSKSVEMLQGVLNILKNDKDSLRKFTIDVMNINYDFKQHSGVYSILNSMQIEWLHQIHLLRKSDKEFDAKFRMIVTYCLGVCSLLWLLSEVLTK